MAAVGSRTELQARYPAAARVRVQAITPGVHDAHLHPVACGRSLAELSLAGVTDPREAAARVRERARSLPAGAWVTDTGYLFDGYPPSNVLDEAAPITPFFCAACTCTPPGRTGRGWPPSVSPLPPRIPRAGICFASATALRPATCWKPPRRLWHRSCHRPPPPTASAASPTSPPAGTPRARHGVRRRGCPALGGL